MISVDSVKRITALETDAQNHDADGKARTISMDSADLVEPLKDDEDGVSNNDRPSMISDNSNNSVLLSELDRSKLKHRIFAQFMKDGSFSEVMDSGMTAKTAATATFGDEAPHKYQLDSSKAGTPPDQS